MCKIINNLFFNKGILNLPASRRFKFLSYCQKAIIFYFVLFPVPCFSLSPSDFTHRAEITTSSSVSSGEPVQVALTAEMFSFAQEDRSDIRIFDERGGETPYAIYRDSPPMQEVGRWFLFRLISYTPEEVQTTLIFENPESERAFERIDFTTTSKDFKKNIELQTSSDMVSWTDPLEDTIFDFSSRINLRKTTIELPSRKARYVRVIFKDQLIAKDGTEMNLRYNGLEFSVNESSDVHFKIDSIRGQFQQGEKRETISDRLSILNLQQELDEDRNSFYKLGTTSFPLERLKLKINNSYYYRAVELWKFEKNPSKKEAQKRVVGRGVIYKFPGMSKSEDTILLGGQTTVVPFEEELVLQIINGDNPPLQVTELEFSWARQVLYFVPEPSRKYHLYVGNDSLLLPKYELMNLIPHSQLERDRYPLCTLGVVEKNPGFKRSKKHRSFQGEVERNLLNGIVLFVVVGLGLWMYRLLKKVSHDGVKKR